MGNETFYGDGPSHTINKQAKAKFSGQSGASWLPNPQKAYLS